MTFAIRLSEVPIQPVQTHLCKTTLSQADNKSIEIYNGPITALLLITKPMYIASMERSIIRSPLSAEQCDKSRN